MSNSENKRIEWIDTAKGIGLLFVILGHLQVPYLSTWIYTFHMPLFFFLSGVVFSGAKYTFKDFCFKKLKSLVVPYFSLGLVIYLFYVIVNMVVGPENGLYGTNLEMLENFFVQEHFWTVWFLACLFVVEVLYYCIWKVFSGWNWGPTIVSVSIGILGMLRYRWGCSSLPWNIDIALVAQFFFHMGYCFKRSQKFKKILINASGSTWWIYTGLLLLTNALAGILCIKLSGASLDMSIGMYGNEVLTILSAVAGILFIVMISQRINNKFFTYLGQNTMILFAWHSRIIIVLCGYIYDFLGIFQRRSVLENWVYAGVTFLIILFVLIPINENIKKSKLHSLFGVRGNET